MAVVEDTLSTTPGSGPNIRAVRSAGGVLVPASTMEAIGPGDLPIDLRATASGRLSVDATQASLSASGSLGALNAVIGPVSTVGMASLSATITTAVVGTIVFEGSPDGASGWSLLSGARTDGANAAAFAGTVVNPAATSAYEMGLPGWVNFARIRVSAYTSGTGAAVLVASGASIEPVVSVAGALPAGTNTIGAVTLGNNSGIVGLNASTNIVGAVREAATWFDETSTVLAAGATFTGLQHDLTANVAGITALGYTGRLEIGATSDQPFTLAVEVSRDGTTYRRWKTVTAGNTDTSQAGAGGAYVAELTHIPKTRYARVIQTNIGSVAQTFNLVQSIAHT